MGRRWYLAQEVLGEFCNSARQRVLDTLENGTATDVAASVMMLQVIKQFGNNAQSYIDCGRIAEKRLRENGEGE